MTVKVRKSPIPDQLWSALRTFGVVVGTTLVNQGYLSASMASAIGGILLAGVPIVIGQLQTRKRATQLATVAASPKVPDSVAQIKE